MVSSLFLSRNNVPDAPFLGYDLRRLSQHAPATLAAPPKPTPVPRVTPITQTQYSSTSYQNADGDTVTLSTLAQQHLQQASSTSSNQTVRATDKRVDVSAMVAHTSAKDGYALVLSDIANFHINLSVDGVAASGGATASSKTGIDAKLLSSTFLADGKIGVQVGDNATIDDIFNSVTFEKYNPNMQTAWQTQGNAMNDVVAALDPAQSSPPWMAPSKLYDLVASPTMQMGANVAIHQGDGAPYFSLSIGLDANGHVLDPTVSDTSQAVSHVNIQLVYDSTITAVVAGRGTTALATATNAYASVAAASQSIDLGGADITVASADGVQSQVTINSDSEMASSTTIMPFTPSAQVHVEHAFDLSHELVRQLIA